MNDIETQAGMYGQEVIRYSPGRPSQGAESGPRVSIGHIGGVTSYRPWEEQGQGQASQGLGIPMAPAPKAPTLNRVHTGSLSLVVGGSQPQEHGVTRINSADLAPTNGGILGTLQNNAGFPTSVVSPNATVELPGMGRTSVKVAAALGYLTRTPDGRYVEAAPGNAEGGLQSPAQAQTANNSSGTQEQQQAAGLDLFDSIPTASGESLEQAYGALIEPIQQGTYDAMLASATAHLAQDGDLDSLIGSLVSRYGSDITSDYSAFHGAEIAVEGDAQERAKSAIKAGADMWQAQADRHVKAAGIEPSDFYEWARETNPEALKQAIQGQLFGRSLKGYTDLMNSYFDNVPPTLEALQRGGIPTKQQGGTVFVQLGGSWMSLDSAVKARLV